MSNMMPQPLPGVKIKAPLVAPNQGQVIIGYQLISPDAGCCKCATLNTGGWLAVIVIAIIFPCVACIPCMMESLHESYQVPVFGNPGDAPPPPHAGGGYPAQAYPAQGYPQQPQPQGVQMQPPAPVDASAQPKVV